MTLRRLGRCALLALAVGAGACTKSPISPAGSVTVTVASPVAPANGATIANASQPVTLTVRNGFVSAAPAGVSYRFEVATDAGFANKVLTRDVAQTSDQTLLTLDVLPPGRDYFWHVSTTAADTVGAFTSALKFTIGPAVVIQAPASPVPASGTTGAALRPVLTVANAARTGPAGSLTYTFDVSTTSTFSNSVVSATVAEGASSTSFALTADLAVSSTFFWRVQVTDALNRVTSPFSPTWTFTTVNPNDLWPGVQPPGTTGKAVRGDNWQTQDLVSWTGVRFTSPTLEMRRLFDLLDRGFDPQAAIDWMRANGYPVTAAWFPSVQAIGFEFMYMALINGKWDLIYRTGA